MSSYALKIWQQSGMLKVPATMPCPMCVGHTTGKVQPPAKVQLLLHLFGLNDCRQTKIGDSRVRGVSGGEKKRVTVAEQLVRPTPVSCMDEISTGLDAKVTLDIIKALRMEVDLLKTTRIMTLLQPPPAVYELFDDFLLLGVGGRLAYHGPQEAVAQYFAQLGFLCPTNVDLLDFLVDVCNENGAQYYHPTPASSSGSGLSTPLFDRESVRSGASAVPPRRWMGAAPPDCTDLSDLWRASSMGALAEAQASANRAALRSRATPEQVVETSGWLGYVKSHDLGTSWVRSLQVSTVRHATIMWRDVIYARQRLLQACIQAFVLATMFWQAGEPRHSEAASGSSEKETVIYRDHVKISVIFLVCGVQMTSSIAILEVINAKRPLFYKLRDAQFFPTLVYTLSEGVAELPLQLLDSTILATITFFCVGLHSPTFPVFYTAVIGTRSQEYSP